MTRLIRMDYGAFGYTEGYYRFKQGLPFIKIKRYKAKWRQDAFATGLKMGWDDAKADKKSAVYIYQPK